MGAVAGGAATTTGFGFTGAGAGGRRTFTERGAGAGWCRSTGCTTAFALARPGYELGDHISNVDRYLLPIIAVVILVSFIPVAVEVVRVVLSSGFSGGRHRHRVEKIAALEDSTGGPGSPAPR